MVCNLNSRKLCGDIGCNTCFDRSFATNEHALEWSDKNEQSALEICKSSHKNIFFDCDVCKHEIEQSPAQITNNNRWCAYCANKKLCTDEECNLCYNKSFASSERADSWSNKNEITPRNVSKNCNKDFIFDCSECCHEFNLSPAVITSQNQWCPFCANKRLCDDNDCDYCFKKSFASHKKSKYWSPKNDKLPREIFLGCENKYIFDCKCGHEICMRIADITSKRQSWCKYCTKKALCEDYDCQMCENNSFLSHEKAEYWSQDNDKCQREVSKTSHTKIIFICENGHKFPMSPGHITCGKCWCPFCENKTEGKLYDWFNNNDYDVIYQQTFDWCKNINVLPFDFCIEEYKLIIELDGRQHFEQVQNWDDPKITRENDIYKMKKAIKHGYTIIRLLQNDVWHDKNNWETKLEEHLYYHKKPTCVFISSGNEYKHHKKAMIKYLK